MTPKHTPGSWTARGTTVWADAATPPMGRMIVANTRTVRGDTHDEANARLIAAAPDMLAALKFVEAHLTKSNYPAGPNLETLRTAIAKAERS